MNDTNEINEELAIQYAVARRQLPGADEAEIARRMTQRLSVEYQLRLADEARLWSPDTSDQRELTLLAVRNFVAAMERTDQRAADAAGPATGTARRSCGTRSAKRTSCGGSDEAATARMQGWPAV